MAVRALNLDTHQGLFRDVESFKTFVSLLRSAIDEDNVSLFSQEELVGTVLSGEAMKEFLLERMVRRVRENPELLTEIVDRLENDEIVE